MNPLTKLERMPLAGPTEARVIAACREAKELEGNYALKALIAGQMLNEFRETLSPSCHSGKTGRFEAKNEADKFSVWIEKNGLAQRTAYRWMQAAERVCRAQLGIAMSEDFRPVIDIAGHDSVPMSLALTAEAKDLPKAARDFRQSIFDFMADHTLSEALLAVADGESDGKRITLAKGGKAKGGKGSGDRKAFDQFAKTKLQHLTTFFRHKLNVNQKALIVAAFAAALELWPRWLLEALAEKCRTELKLTEQQRADRQGF